jgi:hypothetical protein
MPRIVFDWKSDVAPDASARASYASQIAQYTNILGTNILGAERGAVIYMSLGQVQWVSQPGR